ncbi:MAG TPA: alpha/beta fold hydrolase [Candidatus Acidoferrales bacterium]|nr:alpha/beta fold hydrolase [Candidatus Acidoferrales bacterium]
MLIRRALVTLALFGALAWTLVPLARALLLVAHGPVGTTSLTTFPNVSFTASDGVSLVGTYMPAEGARSTVVLVHGFKNTHGDMLEHARFLHDAGYAVLLFDSRGCGGSGGTFGVGATEDRDIIGAVSYLKASGRPASDRVAVLGVSLGAGDALLAAARDPRIAAVVADSSWPDERVQMDRMAAVQIGPLAIPLLPYEPALVDQLIGGRLEDARPRAEVARIAPRPVLFIHSADDQNATTPLADAQAMFAAAGDPKDMWIAPRGGHAGALGANHDEYVRRVLAFLDGALR